ncbi:CheR family methyltransferase [Aquisalibacillus elongatus]|uniref:protein-glutamate O-methyltransferase n=1 Tax=Aquisalibacillus elongatus TaxID=485577 RepID=A0A3N5BFX8_9BACI|nr:protein-glutamate O-methyltransferase CheR [Aquisalibacillus elongatus]RPF55769.1 chemotaxis protein methyltransferase CheR [Aquisalibacillus elongatus]
MKDDYTAFIQDLYELTGIDLSQYKEKQMKRRLTSLRDKRGFQSFKTYFSALKSDQILLHEMLDRMTINVSEFYRNYKRWEILRNNILPDFNTGSSVNVWSAACSTGEEPYTLAMLLSDFFQLNKINILATDLDEQVLQRAKLGVYPDRALKEMPEDKKQAYMNFDGEMYSVDPTIKESVTFQKHNLLSGHYKKGTYDLIVCRNVLIYFTEEAKHRVYQKFADALKPNGILFVGSTEQLFNPKEYGLEVVSTFFYRKIV